MKEYQYILFDLDGTLTDPKEGITRAVAYSLHSFGIEVENRDDLCKFIGPPLRASFMKYYGFDESGAELAVERYREYYRPIGVLENELYDGVKDLLRDLYEDGKKVILATSKPEVFARQILEHFQLTQYFACIVGSELDGNREKKAEVIAYALKAVGVKEVSEAVMIGDRDYDIIGAKENGIDSIGVLYGYGDRKEHEECGAEYIVQNVAELRALLDI